MFYYSISIRFILIPLTKLYTFEDRMHNYEIVVDVRDLTIDKIIMYLLWLNVSLICNISGDKLASRFSLYHYEIMPSGFRITD